MQLELKYRHQMCESIQYSLFPQSTHLRNQICTSFQASPRRHRFSLSTSTHGSFYFQGKYMYKISIKRYRNFGMQKFQRENCSKLKDSATFCSYIHRWQWPCCQSTMQKAKCLNIELNYHDQEVKELSPILYGLALH